MSATLFACPIPAVLPTISDQGDCLASSGNIIGLGFQLVQVTPSFTDSSIKTLATFTPLLASATATALRYVPVVNFSVAAGEAITEGGNDQSTFQGLPKLKGGGYSTATFTLEGVSAALAKEIRALTKFSRAGGGRTKLRVFFFTEDNYVISDADFNGLKTYGLFIGDATKGGSYKPEDMYGGQFYLEYGWSHDAVTTLATFDVSALKNVA